MIICALKTHVNISKIKIIIENCGNLIISQEVKN